MTGRLVDPDANDRFARRVPCSVEPHGIDAAQSSTRARVHDVVGDLSSAVDHLPESMRLLNDERQNPAGTRDVGDSEQSLARAVNHDAVATNAVESRYANRVGRIGLITWPDQQRVAAGIKRRRA